jgi:hypothetical protein
MPKLAYDQPLKLRLAPPELIEIQLQFPRKFLLMYCDIVAPSCMPRIKARNSPRHINSMNFLTMALNPENGEKMKFQRLSST